VEELKVIPVGLKAACSSWTKAAKPALSDSGPRHKEEKGHSHEKNLDFKG